MSTNANQRLKLQTLPFLLLAALLPLLVALASVSAHAPSALSPYSGIPFSLMSAGFPRWGAVAVAPVMFLALCLPPMLDWFRGRMNYLSIIMVLLTLATIVYFFLRFEEGLEHQGGIHVAFMVAANAVGISAFWTMWIRWRHMVSAKRAIALGLVSCCWLFWCGFPYFGEGI